MNNTQQYDHAKISGAAERAAGLSGNGPGEDQPSNEEVNRGDTGPEGRVLERVIGLREELPEGAQGQVNPIAGEVCSVNGGAVSGSGAQPPSPGIDNGLGQAGTGDVSAYQPQGGEPLKSRWEWRCPGVLHRGWRAIDWQVRRVRLSLELDPHRVQQCIELNRRFNKIGALIYGPASFFSGVMLATGHSWWWGLPPATWFVGMGLSHVIFGRCVLNVVVSKMRKFRKGAELKAYAYMKGNVGWAKMPRCKPKAIKESINDEASTPGISSPNNNLLKPKETI